jgi:hypothetical protein
MLRRTKHSKNEVAAPKEEEVMFQKKQALSHTIR